MKANELRIGNLVYLDDIVHTVIGYDVDSVLLNYIESNDDEYGAIADISQLEPIPLTEEWLLKIGFEKINHIHGYSFYSLSKSKKNKGHIDIYDTQTKYMGYSVNHCKYVHQLQNLYFALTGIELTIIN